MRWIGNLMARLLFRRPFVMLGLTGLAQRAKPILKLGRTTLLLRDNDIRDVFDRSDSFELGPVGEEKMLSGEFLLGMDPWPTYLNDKKILIEVLDSSERDLLDEIVKNHCRHFIDGLESKIKDGIPIDLVGDFAEPVVTRIVVDFFLGGNDLPPLGNNVIRTTGVPEEKVYEHVFAHWMRKVGSVIVLPSPAQFGLQKIAKIASADLNAWLDKLIEIRRPGVKQKAGQDNVLDGLICRFDRAEPVAVAEDVNQQPGEDNEIDPVVYRTRRNIAGLMLAGSTPLIKSLVVTIDQLLQHSDILTKPIPVMPSPNMDSAVDVSDTTASDASAADSNDDAGGDDQVDVSSVIGIAMRFEEAEKYEAKARQEVVDARQAAEDRAEDEAGWEEAQKELKRVEKILTEASKYRSKVELAMVHNVYEAMRFNPTFPFLARFCPRDEIVGAVSRNVTEVDADSTIVASQLAAMHDTNVFPDPDVFAYRPLPTYMHFGAGDHECIGKRIATKIITQMAMHVLRLPGIKNSDPGKFSYDGPVVSKYKLVIIP